VQRDLTTPDSQSLVVIIAPEGAAINVVLTKASYSDFQIMVNGQLVSETEDVASKPYSSLPLCPFERRMLTAPFIFFEDL